jgi:hypothetical protein
MCWREASGAGTGSQPTTLVPNQQNEVGLGIGILLGLFSVVILVTFVTVSFGESSLRRTQTTETNLDVYNTISDVEVGKIPVLPYDTSSNTEYAEFKCVTTPGIP